MQLTHQDLVHAYKSLLMSLGMYFNETDNAFYRDGNLQVLVDDRALQLPTQANLTRADWQNNIPFHPVCESIIRKESTVIKKLRAWVNVRLGLSLCDLALNVLAAAVNTNVHAKLPPACSSVLTLFPDADVKAFDLLKKMLGDIETNGDIRPINIYLKIGGELQGVPYRRAAIVSFPILEAFEKAVADNADVVAGYKSTKKAIRTVHALLKWLIGTNDYSRGSSGDIAPYFDALIKSYYAVATRFTEVATMWSSILPEECYGPIELDWAPFFADIPKLKGLIPNLKDNVGEIDEDRTKVPPLPNAPQMPTAPQSVAGMALPNPQSVAALSMPAPMHTAGGTAPKRKLGISVAESVHGVGSLGASMTLNGADDWTKTVTRNETVYPQVAGFPTRGAPAWGQQPQMYAQPQYPGYPPTQMPMQQGMPYQQPMAPQYMQQPVYPPMQQGMPYQQPMMQQPYMQQPYMQPQMPYGYPQPPMPMVPPMTFPTR